MWGRGWWQLIGAREQDQLAILNSAKGNGVYKVHERTAVPALINDICQRLLRSLGELFMIGQRQGLVLVMGYTVHITPSRMNESVCFLSGRLWRRRRLVGELKFNFDGAVNGSFGEAGIGGCLRNGSAKLLLAFSKSVGRVNITTAEILSLLEAVKLYCFDWEISRIPRECNSLADNLVKTDITPSLDYVEEW
ncbi:hypothetical protein V6N13_071473 [Hibiscus sabdariffa]